MHLSAFILNALLAAGSVPFQPSTYPTNHTTALQPPFPSSETPNSQPSASADLSQACPCPQVPFQHGPMVLDLQESPAQPPRSQRDRFQHGHFQLDLAVSLALPSASRKVPLRHGRGQLDLQACPRCRHVSQLFLLDHSRLRGCRVRT